MEGTYTGIVDRIVQDRWAVFEISKDGEWVAELNTAVEEVPEEHRYEGAVFDVEIEGEEILKMHHRPEKEQERRERIRKKAEDLFEPLDSDE